MPRKPIKCAACGEMLAPGSKTLPEGVAMHRRCRSRGSSESPSVNPPEPVVFVASVPEVVPASRREHLEWTRDMLRDSIREAAPDKRGSLVREFRAVLAEIDALGHDETKLEASTHGVIDLRAVVAERVAAAAGAGGAVAGADGR